MAFGFILVTNGWQIFRLLPCVCHRRLQYHETRKMYQLLLSTPVMKNAHANAIAITAILLRFFCTFSCRHKGKWWLALAMVLIWSRALVRRAKEGRGNGVCNARHLWWRPAAQCRRDPFERARWRTKTVSYGSSRREGEGKKMNAVKRIWKLIKKKIGNVSKRII